MGGGGGGSSIDENSHEFRRSKTNDSGLSNVLILIKRSDLLIFVIKKLSDCLVDNTG